MFTWRHFVWLAICIIIIVFSVMQYKKKRPSLQTVLSYGCVICVLSEFIKVFSVIRFVPSADGSIIFPYISTNHLPLHLCSIQILLIFYTRFTENKKMREKILAFMYPSCILGAVSALLMPSIFSTSISVEQAFTHPMAYQFFIFHSMLVVVGICIVLSKEIEWEKKHYYETLIIMFVLGFVSLYINSLLAAPTYLNGELQHVDFWPNFLFTYNNPLGIKLTEIWQWYLYLIILIVVAVSLVTAFYLPSIRKKAR